MSMDELFTYQDMKYYEMGNVALQEQPQKKEVQGFEQGEELQVCGWIRFVGSQQYPVHEVAGEQYNA